MAKDKNAKLDLENVDFFELLAHAADEQKTGLVQDVVQLVRKGDAAAVRLLETAFKKVNPDEFAPMPILGSITQIKDKKLLNEVLAYYSTLQNT